VNAHVVLCALEQNKSELEDQMKTSSHDSSMHLRILNSIFKVEVAVAESTEVLCLQLEMNNWPGAGR
jgi:hypothetical protein